MKKVITKIWSLKISVIPQRYPSSLPSAQSILSSQSWETLMHFVLLSQNLLGCSHSETGCTGFCLQVPKIVQFFTSKMKIKKRNWFLFLCPHRNVKKKVLTSAIFLVGIIKTISLSVADKLFPNAFVALFARKFIFLANSFNRVMRMVIIDVGPILIILAFRFVGFVRAIRMPVTHFGQR